MIKVENEKESYYTCQSCFSNDDITKIIIGLNERQTVIIRLCRKCCKELIKKLSE